MSEAATEKPIAAQLVFKGLLKRMKPVQALVFMALYTQFPARFIPANDFYFKPSEKLVIAPMKIKPAVYYLMLSRLVDAGFLDRRKARSGGLEYRIVFEKLEGFIRPGTAT
jgi:hypothetical protein